MANSTATSMNPGNPPTEITPDCALFETLLRSRHSCRAFLDRPVPREQITRILEFAQLTASWCNAQPWQVHIVSGAALSQYRESLLRESNDETPRPDLVFPQEYPGVYSERRRDCAWRLYDSVGIRRGDRDASARQGRENFRMFGAPHVAIMTMPTVMGVYAAVDCGAYVSNFMLAAQSQGVASIAQAAQAAYPDIARHHLGLAPDRVIVCGISFGYEDPAHPANGFRTARAPLSESVVWVGEDMTSSS